VELFGDLERAFATSLYPLRVPIAIGLAVALIGLVWVARRRGWFATARRHPGRTVVLAALVLAIALPTGWYLGSPLFVRTSLVEAAPTFGPAGIGEPTATRVPVDAQAAPSAPNGAGPAPAPKPRSGTFTGADEFHFGRGTATLLETAPGEWVVRFEAFSVRNGPNLYVYLSPDPTRYRKSAVELGPLKATDGDFNTKVPAGTDVSTLHSVVIWCKQFGVQFAVAPLS